MPDNLNSEKRSSPSYYLGVKTTHREVFKRESALSDKDEEDAILAAEKRFNSGELVNNIWEKYFLIKRYWILPILKGADMVVEEARLEIKKEGVCNWNVKRIGDFHRVI
jgi:hypothetical protein